MDSTDPERTSAMVPGSWPGPRPGPPPRPVERRRVARLVPAQSPRWVVLEVVRAGLEPSWVPTDAAQALLADVDDLRLLRCARARLRAAAEDRMTLCVARAVATLNTAIGLLEHDGDLAETDARLARDDGRSAP